MNAQTICNFLGWCVVFNFGVMLLQTGLVLGLSDKIVGLHSRMFKLEAEAVRLSYFRYLANYKIAFIVFNLVPYLAMWMVLPG